MALIIVLDFEKINKMFLLVLVLDRFCLVLISWPRLSLISASAGMASKPEVVTWGPVTKKNVLVVVACFLSLYETFDQNKHFYRYLFVLRNHLIHFFVIFAIIDQNLTKIFVKQMPISTKSTQSSKILLRKPFLLSVMKTTWSFPIKIRAR